MLDRVEIVVVQRQSRLQELELIAQTAGMPVSSTSYELDL
jgi:hypothetical protein